MDYLYRVKYKGDVVFESNERKQIDFFIKLMREKDETVIERSELVWWPVPPENSDTGVT